MNGIEENAGSAGADRTDAESAAHADRAVQTGGARNRWLNLLIPLAVLVAIAFWVDLRAVASALAAIPGSILAAGLLLATLDRFAMTYKWRQLVLSGNAKLPFTVALRIHYQSMVSGRVIPLPLGADVLRAWLAARAGIPQGLVLSSIVIEKLLAMLTAALMSLAGLLYLVNDLAPGIDKWTIFSLIAVGLGAAIAALGLILVADTHRAGRRVLSWFNSRKVLPVRLAQLFKKTSQSLLRFRSQRRALATHLGLAALEYVVQLVKLVVLAYGLGIPGAGLTFAAIAAVALFVRRITGIVESWALGEGSAVVTLALLGIDAELAVALLVANFAISTVAILPGAILFYTHPLKRRDMSLSPNNDGTRRSS